MSQNTKKLKYLTSIILVLIVLVYQNLSNIKHVTYRIELLIITDIKIERCATKTALTNFQLTVLECCGLEILLIIESMFWWQRRRITMARRNDNNSNNNNNSRRIVFPATFLSVALLGIYFLISVYLQLRHDKFISDVSNIDSIHRLASTIDRPVTISTTSIIDRVKTNQNSATSIDSLAKRNNLTNIHQRLQQQKLKSKPTILPETADHLIQLSLQYDVKNLTDQLMNNTLIYFPGTKH